jgi:hypothetical protein
MKSLKLYVALSLLLHLAFFGAIIFNAARKPRQAYDIYEVSIVAAPAPGATIQGQSVKPSPRVPVSTVKGFEQITKAQAVKDQAPSFKPVDLENTSTSKRATPSPPSEDDTPENPGSPTGAGPSMGERVRVSMWVTDVQAIFRSVWQAPYGAPIKKDLKASFTIRVARSGEILSKQLLLGSGNALYDKSVELALGKIKKLPPPPIGGEVAADYTITFIPPAGS